MLELKNVKKDYPAGDNTVHALKGVSLQFRRNEFVSILGPSGCGKTTLLRDIIRQLSNGREGIPGLTVGVVDERSELAGCCQGITQNDLGMRTDILDGCPKAEGMQMLIRSMSPHVVAVDELGKEEDFKAVESVIHCGCKLLATTHGYSLEDIIEQPMFQRLLEGRVFERYIVLEKRERAGMLAGIYDREGMPC
jgi:stage III sporulation protein AA